MDEEYWNLDQALAWVKWRNYDIVRTLQTVSHFSNATYFSDFNTPYDDNERKEYANTDFLLNLLRSGDILSYGYYGEETKKREEIPSTSWIGLEFKTVLRQPVIASPTGNKGLRWHDILLKKLDIEAHFYKDSPNYDVLENLVKKQAISNNENLINDLPKIKQTRKNTLISDIGRIMSKLEGATKRIPPNKIHKYIKNNYEDLDLESNIQEIKNDIIYWTSALGVQRSMGYERFQNIVSEYNTRKRTLPE